MNRKKYLLTFLANLFIFFVSGQHGYKITYQAGYPGLPVQHYKRLILTDTALLIIPVAGINSSKKQTQFGRRIQHHSTYFFKSYGKRLFGSKNPAFSKGYLTEALGWKGSDWIADTVITHTYQDFRCANAYRVLPSGDSLFAVYTPDLRYPAGCDEYRGIPGVVLEYVNTIIGFYERVVRIEEGDYQIVWPDKMDIRLPKSK